MSAEESGLLGNLPRSRPGTRSDKREAGPAKPKARAAAPATKAGAGASATAKRAPARRASSAPKRAAGPPGSPPPERPTDPVGNVLKGVARTAGAGLRVADGVTRGVLRRLPRP